MVKPKTKKENVSPPDMLKFVDEIRARHQYNQLLTADIMDNYNQLRPRYINVHEDNYAHSCVKKSIENAEFVENLEKYLDGKIRETYMIQSSSIKTRKMTETHVYFDVVKTDGGTFPTDLKLRCDIEFKYFMCIASFLANEDWYMALSAIEMQMRATSNPHPCDAVRLKTKVSFDGYVPDEVVFGMYYRACTTLCSYLDPLVFFWQRVMTKSWIDKSYVNHQTTDTEWMPVERTAMLTIFFLQYVGLLPNLVKETDVFDRSKITWQNVTGWDSGIPFFTIDFKLAQQAKAERSKVSHLNVGELFAMMLKFYVDVCPLECGKYNLDNGTYEKTRTSDKHFIIDTSLCKTPNPEDLYFPSRKYSVKIFKNLLEELGKSESNCPGDDLIRMCDKIRQDYETVNNSSLPVSQNEGHL